MSELAGRRIDAQAFRARRFPTSTRQQVRIHNGPPLPAACLPTPPPATDTAAAPRRPPVSRARVTSTLPPHDRSQAASLPESPPPPQPAPSHASDPDVPLRKQASSAHKPVTSTAADLSSTRQAAAPRMRAVPPPRQPATTAYPRKPPASLAHTAAPPLRSGPLALALLTGLSVGLAMAWWLVQINALTTPSPPAASASGSNGSSGSSYHSSPLAPAAAAVTGARAVSKASSQEASRSPAPPLSQPVDRPPVAAIDVRDQRGPTSAQARAPSAETVKANGDAVRKRARLATAAKIRKPSAKSPGIAGQAATKRGTIRANEIDRLKSQAYSESSRDRLRRSPPPRPATTGADGAIQPVIARASPQASAVPRRKAGKTGRVAREQQRASITRRQFDRCEKIGGLLQREKCKWEVCGARWDSVGCPSYAREELVY